MRLELGWTVTLLLAAAALGSARADSSGEPQGDPALRLYLGQVPASEALFLIGAETRMGFELEGEVSWSADNQEVAVQPIRTRGGEALDLRRLTLYGVAVVCAEVRGRLSLGGDLGRDVVERQCILAEWGPGPEPPVLGGLPPSREPRSPGSRAPLAGPARR